jgi:hypothetical protein
MRYPSSNISARAQGYINKSWALETEATYSSAWRQWARYCDAHHLDMVNPSVMQLLDFLILHQFEDKGQAYRMVKMYQSTVSSMA